MGIPNKKRYKAQKRRHQRLGPPTPVEVVPSDGRVTHDGSPTSSGFDPTRRILVRDRIIERDFMDVGEMTRVVLSALGSEMLKIQRQSTTQDQLLDSDRSRILNNHADSFNRLLRTCHELEARAEAGDPEIEELSTEELMQEIRDALKEHGQPDDPGEDAQ